MCSGRYCEPVVCPDAPVQTTSKNCLRVRKALQHRSEMLPCMHCEVHIYVLFSCQLHHSLIDFLHVNDEIAPTECCSVSCILPPLHVSYLSDYSGSSICLGFCQTRANALSSRDHWWPSCSQGDPTILYSTLICTKLFITCISIPSNLSGITPAIYAPRIKIPRNLSRNHFCSLHSK